jgi:hypothetical protein
MKRLAVYTLLAALAVASSMPADAQYHTNGKKEARAQKKAQKKQQKAQKKYAKAQKKAQRKMAKQDRKNTHLPSHY